MPLPSAQGDLLAWAFAAERMDAWVLRVSIAIPLLCVAGLVLWHLVAYLGGKMPKKARAVRYSPEPPSSVPSRILTPRGGATATGAPSGDSPEQLQQACTDLEDSLAGRYMELAECWLRQGQPGSAAAALWKIIQICPEKRLALVARDRLRQIGEEAADHHS